MMPQADRDRSGGGDLRAGARLGRGLGRQRRHHAPPRPRASSSRCAALTARRFDVGTVGTSRVTHWNPGRRAVELEVLSRARREAGERSETHWRPSGAHGGPQRNTRTAAVGSVKAISGTPRRRRRGGIAQGHALAPSPGDRTQPPLLRSPSDIDGRGRRAPDRGEGTLWRRPALARRRERDGLGGIDTQSCSKPTDVRRAALTPRR